MSIQGKTILVTRQSGDNKQLICKLEKLHAQSYEFPAIQLQKKELSEQDILYLESALLHDWIIFSSSHAVSYFFQLIGELGIQFDKDKHLRLAAVGLKTAKTIASLGYSCDFVPSNFTTQDFINEFMSAHDVNLKRIFLPQGNLASNQLEIELEKSGASISKICIYTTTQTMGTITHLRSELIKKNIDALTFASPSSINGFMLQLEDDILIQNVLLLPVVCIGPRTASRAKLAGFSRIAVATPHTSEGLTNALISLFA